MDRIDIHIEVVPVPFEKLSGKEALESSQAIRERVAQARQVQLERFKDMKGVHSNAQMNTKLIRKFCQLDATGSQLIKTAMEKVGLSARAYDRILKVSRTIADLEKSETIEPHHLAEAIQYRSLDRDNWGN